MKPLNLIFILSFLITSTFLLSSCKDDSEEAGQGKVNIKLTDAPIDDAEVKGAYVTVAEVWIDGHKVEGFTKKTVELTAYQQGNALLLLSDTVDAGTHNNISLVLDLEKDDAGNAPGCFVLSKSIVKHNLATSSESTLKIDLDKEFTVNSDGTTDMVIDFDLRKALKYDNSYAAESDYSFVTKDELHNALRAVAEEKAGTIKGKITESATTGDHLVVYAYHKGDFDEEKETSAQGDSKILFANAVSSAEVDESNNYQLSFLEDGDYELHVATFDDDSNGKPVFSGLVEASTVGSAVLLNDVKVQAQTNVSLNINITGILGI